MRRRGVGILAAFAAAVAAQGCGQEPEAVIQAPPVVVTPVVERELVDRIEATGELMARSEAVVAAEVSGRVSEIRIHEGEAAG